MTRDDEEQKSSFPFVEFFFEFKQKRNLMILKISPVFRESVKKTVDVTCIVFSAVGLTLNGTGSYVAAGKE